MAVASSRAFAILYVSDVRRSTAFYESLGFRVVFAHPTDGEPGFVNLRCGAGELGLVDERSPLDLLGAGKGSGLRCEVFVYVDDVHAAVEALRDHAPVLREPADMPWGERLAYVADPDGNPVALAAEVAPGERRDA